MKVFPSAAGTVTLVGITSAGMWVAEHRCLAVDFDESCIVDMERKVIAKERSQLVMVR